MTFGVFRDGHPRLTIDLPTMQGVITVEFIVDTGFEGDIAVPDAVARQLAARNAGSVVRLLADAKPFRCPALELDLELEWIDRTAEVLVLPGSPLVGTTLIRDCQLQAEIVDGGTVSVDPL